MNKHCGVEGCLKGAVARGLCTQHYQAYRGQLTLWRALLDADFTCSSCGERRPRVTPVSWSLSADGVTCPLCQAEVADPTTDPKFALLRYVQGSLAAEQDEEIEDEEATEVPDEDEDGIEDEGVVEEPDDNCPHCHGSGYVTDWVPYGMGDTPMRSPCDCSAVQTVQAVQASNVLIERGERFDDTGD